MRDIKFRAWNFVAKKMYYPENAGNIFLWQKEGQVQEIMQYTGLKDRNGVEIYEGDILKTQFCNCRCEWSGIGWRFKHPTGSFDHELEMEVIGNIYENPDLLK